MKINTIEQLIEEVMLQKIIYKSNNRHESPDYVMLNHYWESYFNPMNKPFVDRHSPNTHLYIADMLIVWTDYVSKEQIQLAVKCH